MNTGGHQIVIDGVDIEYGRVPRAIFKDKGELMFYFSTRQQQGKHDKVVGKAINRLANENESHGVSWRELERTKYRDTYYYQLTVVSFRIRDIY